MIKYHGIDLVNTEQYQDKGIKYPEIGAKCIYV